MTLFDIRIYEEHTHLLKAVLKRLASPKHMTAVPNQALFLVHYTDNLCILYETWSFEEIANIMGMQNDHKGLAFSKNGLHLVYANNFFFQMWNVRSHSIEMLSHDYKSVYCYCLNYNSCYVYCGTFRGEITVIEAQIIKGYPNSLVHHFIKLFQ